MKAPPKLITKKWKIEDRGSKIVSLAHKAILDFLFSIFNLCLFRLTQMSL
jgi:hypothetical protein